MEKYCNKCKLYKKFEEFNKHKKGKYGLYSICKVCRKNIYDKKSQEINLNYKNCNTCLKRLPINQFYKNKNVKSGVVGSCKVCYLKNRSKNQSKIENYMKIILNKFKKKHKTDIKLIELIRTYNFQQKRCFISKHKMTHIIDNKGRSDNIFNISIIPLEKKKIYKINDIRLAINLFDSVSKKYNLDTEKILEIYKELT